jgi:hypothetical protein
MITSGGTAFSLARDLKRPSARDHLAVRAMLAKTLCARAEEPYQGGAVMKPWTAF